MDINETLSYAASQTVRVHRGEGERGEAESYLELKGLLVEPESKWSNYKKRSVSTFYFWNIFFSD